MAEKEKMNSMGRPVPGANIAEPLEKKPWGLRQFTVKDLDGNLFYFHHD